MLRQRKKKLLTSSQLGPLSVAYTNMEAGGAPVGVGGTDWAEPRETARNTCKRLVFLMQPHKSSHCSSIPSKHRSSRLKHQEVSSTGILSKFILI